MTAMFVKVTVAVLGCPKLATDYAAKGGAQSGAIAVIREGAFCVAADVQVDVLDVAGKGGF